MSEAGVNMLKCLAAVVLCDDILNSAAHKPYIPLFVPRTAQHREGSPEIAAKGSARGSHAHPARDYLSAWPNRPGRERPKTEEVGAQHPITRGMSAYTDVGAPAISPATKNATPAMPCCARTRGTPSGIDGDLQSDRAQMSAYSLAAGAAARVALYWDERRGQGLHPS